MGRRTKAQIAADEEAAAKAAAQEAPAEEEVETESSICCDRHPECEADKCRCFSKCLASVCECDGASGKSYTDESTE